ncbi:MAG: tRNA pseudouridine(38-40) synthase TruA [Candidatus Geothermincolia bacterium]
MNIKLVCEYDGTAYNGFQYQPGLPTIQGALQGALERVATLESPLYAAGRTDTGVHARGQVVNVNATTPVPPERMAAALNSLLPPDISVSSAEEVPDSFNSRHDAVSREYRYHILNREAPSALARLYSYHFRAPLDFEAMNEALGQLAGVHDFSALSCPEEGRSAVREVIEAELSRCGDMLILRVIANAFIYRMMRLTAGALLAVGAGRWSPQHFADVLRSRDVRLAAPALPARGLVLERVKY